MQLQMDCTLILLNQNKQMYKTNTVIVMEVFALVHYIQLFQFKIITNVLFIIHYTLVTVEHFAAHVKV